MASETTLALEAVKANPTGSKNILDKILDELHHLDKIIARILPGLFQTVRINKTASRKKLSPVYDRNVSDAIKLAELKEDEVDRFLCELK